MSPLSIEISEDIQALALTLARARITHEGLHATCEVCCFSWNTAMGPRHADACAVGNVFRLVGRLGELRDEESAARAMLQHDAPFQRRPVFGLEEVSADEVSERYIEYSAAPINHDFAAVLDSSGVLALRRVTHEQAALAAAEGCR